MYCCPNARFPVDSGKSAVGIDAGMARFARTLAGGTGDAGNIRDDEERRTGDLR